MATTAEKKLIDLQATDASDFSVASSVASGIRRSSSPIRGIYADTLEDGFMAIMGNRPVQTEHEKRFRHELIARAATSLGFKLMPAEDGGEV